MTPMPHEVTPEKTPCFVLSVFSLGVGSRGGAWNLTTNHHHKSRGPQTQATAVLLGTPDLFFQETSRRASAALGTPPLPSSYLNTLPMMMLPLQGGGT